MVLWEVAHGVSAPLSLWRVEVMWEVAVLALLSLWRVGVGESYTLGHTGNRCRVRRARLEPQSFFLKYGKRQRKYGWKIMLLPK